MSDLRVRAMNASAPVATVLVCVSMLAGCASLHDGEASAPPIEISVARMDEATGTATIGITNRSKRRVLILSNMLVWRDEATPKRVERPNHHVDDQTVLLMHDIRLEAGGSIAYMDVRLDAVRPSYPAIHACWDNRNWTCDRYWLIPAHRRWDELIRKQPLDTDGPRLENGL